jgi:outer membrane protein assembly factor BamB
MFQEQAMIRNPRMLQQDSHCPERAGLQIFSRLARAAILLVFVFPATTTLATALAADWPTWRYDAARSARTSQTLPKSLHLQWVRQYPKLKPAYRAKRIQFDAGYEPVVLGKTMFVASSLGDSVTALDLETGRQRWRFHAEGPVRLAPVAWKDRVFFGSDDGHLYCLSAQQGRLLWKFRAVPSGRKILGDGRLISVWPVRGGPVLDDGKIYFAAGVFPFEGVFIYSLDAETGRVVWLNDRCGYLYGQHPHNAESLGGITPQGYLVVSGNELIVPCGQAVPARFDLRDGKLLSFELPKPGRRPGGWFVSADVRRGKVVLDADINRDLHEDKVYQGPGEPGVRTTIRVGERILKFGDGFPGVEGDIHTMLAADDKLVVVTVDGKIYCFGPRKPAAVARYPLKLEPLRTEPEEPSALAKRMVDTIADRHGYVLILGIADAGLLEILVKQTKCRVIAVDPDAAKVEIIRRKFDAAGIHGDRLSLLVGKPSEIEFPPYMASVAAVNDVQWLVNDVQWLVGGDAAEMGTSAFDMLRPYGGTAWVNLSDADHARLVAANPVEGSYTITRAEGTTIVRRRGPLPGAVNYTGGWSSLDRRVRAPLGVLWFDDTLGHFKRSPQPMFVDGLMISYPKDWMAKHREGRDPPYTLLPPVLSDVYTGRVLESGERLGADLKFPHRNRRAVQPRQYRPPYQPDHWNPEKPVVGKRINPLTGKKEPRVFPKSYGCDGGVDYGYLYTMRSGTAAFYDKRLESGTCYISGPRSGCTNSIIPACGLLNVPYFYEGCTCSYSLPTGLALVPMRPEYEQWAAWGPGEANDIKRVGVNFGAPGDRMTEAGTLWLDYPSRGGPSPEVKIEVEPASAKFYYHHSLWIRGGSGWPWVGASGVKGASTITISGLRKAKFTVRLYFADPDYDKPAARRFDIALNGRSVAENFDVAKAAGGRMRTIVRQFENIKTDGSLKINLNPRQGEPILSGIEIIL